MNKKSVSIGLLLFATSVLACQVPVFRYALERWPPDMFQLVIYHNEPLQEKEQTVVNFLKDRLDNTEVPINMYVDTLDVTKVENNDFAEWFQEQQESKAPTMVLFYPDPYGGIYKAWDGEINLDNARKLIDSPRRQEIISGILRGDSAVWVVLESGNKEHDDKVVKLMNQYLQEAKEEITLPEGVMTAEEADEKFAKPEDVPYGFDPANVLRSGIPLKLDFSVLRMGRNEPGEEVFTQMLLNMDGESKKLTDKALVFPVFGQGRALEPVTLKEIEEDVLIHAAGYLCGACSCEVKQQNPGVDVLMAVNWWEKLEGSQVIVEKELPPLVGTAEILASAKKVEEAPVAASEPEEEVAPKEKETSAFKTPAATAKWRNMGVVLAAVMAGLGLATIKAMRSKI